MACLKISRSKPLKIPLTLHSNFLCLMKIFSFQLISIYDIQVVDEILEVCLFLKLDLNLQQT